ncbi:MAG: hypothetical protein Q8941_06705 [Bacteroidota bacterium]|nr:hypothetical protein [Bacteroidota bacterium]
MVIRLVTIVALMLSGTCVFSQDSLRKNKEEPLPDYDLWYEHHNCKLPELVYIEVTGMPVSIPLHSAVPVKNPLLTATGEMSYQHFDRNGNSDDLLLINSSSDIAMLKLGLLYKETYPFTLSVRYNRSHPFQLDNQYEVNIGFDDRLFRQRLREKMINSAKNDFLKKQLKLKDEYQRAFNLFQQQKQLLKSPAYIQQAVESRLKNSIPDARDFLPGEIPVANHKFDPLDQWLGKLPGYSDLQKREQRIKDSIERKMEKLNWEEMQKKLQAKLEQQRDSLGKRVKKLEDSLAFEKKALEAKLDSVNKEVAGIYSSSDLKKYAERKGLKDSAGTDKWADVLMKSNIRLGKFLLNNSELTVNNIFLLGASIKYGEEKFVIVSGGYYDFAFRQVFNFRNDTLPRSKPSVFAVKIGKTDGDNLSAFNFYIGKKSRTGLFTEALRTVAGISLERKTYFSRNLSADFEIAKSTTRPDNLSAKSEETVKDLFTRFSTKTIGMYSSVKAYMPKTSTDAEVSYRYWGQQFESFNASQYFNPQNNLAAKLSQPLFKRKVYLTGGIRYTDFSSFGIASNMKTKAIFASMNAVLRLKNMPIISMGYYPGSQLYWLDQAKLYEYFYYILNATVSHYFRVAGIPVQAVFSWNKFYNRYTDSLVAGSQSYYNFFITAWKNKFSYTMNISRQEIENNRLITLEGGLNYSEGIMKIGASVKGNFTGVTSRMGYSFCSGWVLKKIGTINLIYDRSFLPGRTGQFIPVKTGQVQIIKPLKFTLWH